MTTEAPLTVAEKSWRKLIAFGAFLFFYAMKFAYRIRSIGRLRLQYVDHVTIPCDDLHIAERFYVGVMGARVLMRVDTGLLLKMGWSHEQIERYHAVHVSLTIAAGPRLDLFEYPLGKQREDALHPHVAFRAPPSQFLTWQRHLLENGVKLSGPTRPGPPGQASFYFNDPFGNHLEIVSMGYVKGELPVGMQDRSNLNYIWRS